MFVAAEDLTSGLIIQLFLRNKGGGSNRKGYHKYHQMHFLKLFDYIFRGCNYNCFYEQFTGKLKSLGLKNNYPIPLAKGFIPAGISF